MVKDKIFVCERCQVRLNKEAAESPSLKTAVTPWDRDLHRKLKVRYIDEHGKKPERRLVRTSCLGSCPKERISYEELKDGQVKCTKSYPADLGEEDVYKLVFGEV